MREPLLVIAEIQAADRPEVASFAVWDAAGKAGHEATLCSSGALRQALPTSGVCVYYGTVPDDVIDWYGCPVIGLDDLAMILLPQNPRTDLVALAELLNVKVKGTGPTATCERIARLFTALRRRAEALPLPVIYEVATVLQGRRCQSLKRLFDQLLLQRELSAKTGDRHDACSLSEVVPPDQSPACSRPPTPDVLQPLPMEAVDDLLGLGGMFAQAFPMYEFREGQLQMAHGVVDAFNSASHLMVEAGTGTGKSLAYLEPAVQWALLNKTPVVISTNTKNLQSQLFEKDLPLIRSVTGLDFKAALIKGRSNYLCLRKLVYLLDHASFELRIGQHELTASVLVWITQTQTGDLSELSGLDARGSAHYASLLGSSAEECAGRNCPHYRHCFLRRARSKSMAADIVVANHALVFAEMQEKSQAIPPHGYLVLDEAHNLEEAATRHFSIEVSSARLRFLLRRVGRVRTKARTGLLGSFLHQLANRGICPDPAVCSVLEELCQKLNRASETIEQALEPFFGACAGLLPASGGGMRRLQPDIKEGAEWGKVHECEQVLRQKIAVAVETLGSLIERLEDIDAGTLGFNAAFINDFDAMRSGFTEQRDDIAFMLDLDAPGMVFWVEADDRSMHTARLMAAPIDVGDRLHASLYLQKSSIIFTSATLSVRDRYEFLMKRLGLDRIEHGRLHTLNVGSPFDYARQSVLMVPMFLPEPTASDQAYDAALGAFLAKLFRRTRGRGLSLFTSYTMLQKTTAAVRELLHDCPISVLAQGESASREDLTEQFRTDVSSVLMGTHSFWEGVDVVGESLSCVVLARLPFAVFTDPVVAARCEALEAAGQSAFSGFSLPNAVIRFRQGFGRLIRHRKDRGIVIVADRRMMTQRYGHWFRSSVPVPAVKCFDEDAMLDAVEAFLAGE